MTLTIGTFALKGKIVFIADGRLVPDGAIVISEIELPVTVEASLRDDAD